MTRRKIGVVTLFSLPAVLLYAWFFVSPIGETLFYSLFDWDAISPRQWIGLGNYGELLTDAVFFKALGHTLYLTGLLFALQIPLGFLLAYVLFQQVRGYKLLRAIYFMPVITSSVAIALVFYFIYDPNFGMLNTILERIGLGQWGKVWLSDTSTAMTAVSLPLVWKYVGLMMIVIFAGLQSIPPETLEAAELDGAGGFQKMTKIVIPMIRGVLQVCFVLALTSAFKQFDFVLILTQGGPIHRTEVTGTYMYKMGFNDMRYGFGSAVATAIMLLTLLLMPLIRLIAGKGDKT
ncbi:carbohydrate ABC transporter permease [Paenibacillaceae bacterium WGS1546]|uniref:carbohydrate ABC transporter permease n=1 Tax=Cohnella sp. WGS1546 TaxID=3366810 RepID=UPI00372D5726